MNGPALRERRRFVLSAVSWRRVFAAHQHERAYSRSDVVVPGSGRREMRVAGTQVEIPDAALAFEHDAFLVLRVSMARDASTGLRTNEDCLNTRDGV